MKEFEVGQDVVIDGSFTRRISKIVSKTPKGFFKVHGEEGLFNPNGRKRGSDSWRSTWMRHVDEKERNSILKVSLVQKIRHTVQDSNFNLMQLEQLQQLSELLDSFKTKESK